MGKTWKVEDRFRRWGEPVKKIGDDFTDWALELKKQHDEILLEDELRELFIKELYEQES